MEKSKISVTVIKSVTAVVCCIAIAVAGNSAIGKLCANREEVAKLTSTGVATGTDYSSGESYSTDSGSDFVSENESASVTENASGNDFVIEEGTTDSSADPAKVISITDGLNSTDKAEILQYYQLVMTKNEKDGLGHNQTMTLQKLDGGSGGVGGFISMFEPIAKAALADNSTSHEGLPGVHDKIQVSDWASAKAVNDGKYTTVTIKLVEQTDGPYGKTSEGTVGRSIGVLDGVATALAEINGLEADFQNGKLLLKYQKPQITIKVDNKTGSLVKGACSWSYQVYVDIQKLDVKMSIFSLSLNGAVGIVDMVSSY